MKQYLIEYDANRQPSSFYGQSDCIYAAVLAANTMKTITVPTGATFVQFSATGNFFCKLGGNVTVPATDILDGTSGELNPTKLSLFGVSTLTLIASAATTVTLSFFKKNYNTAP